MRKHIENEVKLIIILKCTITLPWTTSRCMFWNFLSVILLSNNMVGTTDSIVWGYQNLKFASYSAAWLNCTSCRYLRLEYDVDVKVFFFIHQLKNKWIVTILKYTLKLTLKQLWHISLQSCHHQGAHYSCLLKLQSLKYPIKIHRCVVMWSHILVGPCWCVYIAAYDVATYTHQQGPTDICSHITTHRCILIGYFSNCDFSKHK